MRRISRLAVLSLLLVLALGGSNCTSFVFKTAYNQAETLVLYRVNSIFALNSSQRDFLSERFRAHHRWHRTQELPRYAAALTELRTRVEGGLEPADVDWLFARGESFRDSIYRRIEGDTTRFLTSLDESQVERLPESFRSYNEDLREKVEQPRGERLAERAEKTLEFYEDWFGGLSASQRSSLNQMSRALPDTEPLRLQSNRLRQAELVRTLQDSDNRNARVEAMVADWMRRPEASRTAGYRAALQSWRSRTREMILRFDDQATPEQRAYFIARLDELIADLRELSRG